jgi:hypothetical protein
VQAFFLIRGGARQVRWAERSEAPVISLFVRAREHGASRLCHPTLAGLGKTTSVAEVN